MGLLWELVPQPTEGAKTYDWFLFYEQSMAPQWYAYLTIKHVAAAVTGYLLVIVMRGDVVARWFFYAHVLQIADFWLTYHTTWFNIGTLPITMNIVQMGMYAFSIYLAYRSGVNS